MKTLIHQTLSRRFGEDRSGNIAPMFAMFVLPVVVAVGGMVDYGSAYQARTEMRAAVDAAAVTAARTFASTGSETTAQSAAETHFHSAIDGVKGALDPVDFSTFGKVVVTASGQSPNAFLGLVGLDSFDIDVQSSVKMEGKELELSVMLDLTGSMRNDMDELKLAAADLLDIVLRPGEEIRRIAFVPFSHAINGGDYFDAITGHENSDSDGDGWDDNIPASTENWCEYYIYYTWHWYWQQVCNPWRPQNVSYCMTGRDGSHNNTDEAPGPNRYFGMYDQTRHNSSGNNMSSSSCRPSNSPIIPLTNDRDVLEASINAWQADGTTAGHLGTKFAWYMLSPKWNAIWPTESQAGAYNTDELLKIAILMSDGEYNVWYTDGEGNSVTQARETCDEMKAQGIEIYSIGFDMNPGASSDTLIHCASSDEHYFFPYDGDALRQDFKKIGARIAMAAEGITIDE